MMYRIYQPSSLLQLPRVGTNTENLANSIRLSQVTFLTYVMTTNKIAYIIHTANILSKVGH